MHEMEFLPTWYPQLRRRKRRVVLQLWATILVVTGFALWTLLARENVARRLSQRGFVAAEVEQSRADLKALNEQLKEKEKLEGDAKIVEKVGLHVEASRLLAKLDELMPREMTLTEANFDTVESVQKVDGATDSRQTQVSRKLLVKMSGVTPSDADWASVLAKLSSVPYFQDVRLVGAHDKVDSGHLMRQFDVSFVVDLGTGG